MPALTAKQLVWTGITLVVLGVGVSSTFRVLYDVYFWAAPGPFSVLVGLTQAMGMIGATLLAGGLVVARVRRRAAPPGIPTPAEGDNPLPPSG